MKIVKEPTVTVQIFMAGPRKLIEERCAEYCFRVGLCVSIEKTRFIYNGGIEDGVAIRLVNYPRFPSTLEAIEDRAAELANLLIGWTYQHSALVVGPVTTQWLTRREEALTPATISRGK